MRGDSSGQCRVGTGKRGAGMRADRGVGMRRTGAQGRGQGRWDAGEGTQGAGPKLRYSY